MLNKFALYQNVIFGVAFCNDMSEIHKAEWHFKMDSRVYFLLYLPSNARFEEIFVHIILFGHSHFYCTKLRSRSFTIN
jgi:hypothetical protein